MEELPKRSVSETKKKYVAAQQNWLLWQIVNANLPAWFEVDHQSKIRIRRV